MDWREYVKMVLAALLPIAYYLIKSKNPDFPLMEEKFVELIIWIIESAFFTKLGYKWYLVKTLSLKKDQVFQYNGFLIW